jgi:hypothetical protein
MWRSGQDRTHLQRYLDIIERIRDPQETLQENGPVKAVGMVRSDG